MAKIKDMSDKELVILVKELSNDTVEEKESVRSTKDCPLCWGDKASLADLRVIACPVAHSEPNLTNPED